MLQISTVLALCCLVVAGVLDVVFKLYASKVRSRGVLIGGIGFVWIVMQLVTVHLRGVDLTFDSATVLYGSIATVFVTASNIMLIEALGRLPISLGSTIYRLNTVPLVLFAVLILGEDLSRLEFAGVVVAIIAVLILHPPRSSSDVAPFWLLVVISASIIRAAYGLVTKLGFHHGADPDTMILLAGIGWCIGGPLYVLMRESGIRRTGRDIAGFSIAGGVLVFGVVWLLTHALRTGDASIVVPVTNMGFVAALVFAIVVGMEQPNRRKLSGVCCAVIAVLLLNSGL